MPGCIRLGGPHFHYLKDEHRKTDAQHTGQAGQYHTFGQYLVHDVAGACTDGPSDTYLGGTFLDRYHHDIAHPDGTGQ